MNAVLETSAPTAPNRPDAIFTRYPEKGLMRAVYRFPITWWRLGLGRVVGRFLVLLTTTGRKSHEPRRVVLEYHTHQGRKYAASSWPDRADWVLNLRRDPYATIQTCTGTEHVRARFIDDEAELRALADWVRSIPAFVWWLDLIGAGPTIDDLIAIRDHFALVEFVPVESETPPAQKPDLVWVWQMIPLAIMLVRGLRAARRARRTSP